MVTLEVLAALAVEKEKRRLMRLVLGDGGPGDDEEGARL